MHILEVNALNARWKYSGKDRYVLKNIHFCVKTGDFVCLSGPNGSGKSTMLSLLSGIIPDGLQVQNKGTVFIKTVTDYRGQIQFMTICLYPFLVIHNLKVILKCAACIQNLLHGVKK